MEATKQKLVNFNDLDYWDQQYMLPKLREYKRIKSFINMLEDYNIDIHIERIEEDSNKRFFIVFDIMRCGFERTKQNEIWFKKLQNEYPMKCNILTHSYIS